MNTTKEIQKIIDPNFKEEPSQTILLGLFGSIASDTIVSDISSMLKNNQFFSLDGYILAISRLVKSEIAWKCILAAFNKQKIPVPEKYAKLFQSAAQAVPSGPQVC